MDTGDLSFEEIDREQTSLGLLTLHRYTAPDGQVGYEVRIDDAFLMATHGAQGEVWMARLAWDALATARDGLHVLVGGLGAGHTLRAALELPGVVRVTVCEIGARVVDWNRRYLPNGTALDDPRVDVVIDDLAALLATDWAQWDIMLLDVDNGPGWLAAPGNASLYEPAGLERCRDALSPGGVLAVWSPSRNDRFLAALRHVFPGARMEATGAWNQAGERGEDAIYLAVRR